MSIKNLSWSNVLAPLVVAVLVGVGASYVTTKVQIGTLQSRVSAAEKDITRLRSKTETGRKSDVQMRERIIRMETKIDLLLQSEGIDSSSIDQ